MFGKCKHDYVLIDKTEFSSPFEQIKYLYESSRGRGNFEMPVWMFEKKIVFVFKCDKCKHLKIEEKTSI